MPLSSCDREKGEYVRSVGISDISSEVKLILARASTFSFHVIFLDGQSVQRIALPWELVGEGEQIDVVFQLGLLMIPKKERLVVVLAKRSPEKFSVTQGSLLR